MKLIIIIIKEPCINYLWDDQVKKEKNWKIQATQVLGQGLSWYNLAIFEATTTFFIMLNSGKNACLGQGLAAAVCFVTE